MYTYIYLYRNIYTFAVQHGTLTHTHRTNTHKDTCTHRGTDGQTDRRVVFAVLQRLA